MNTDKTWCVYIVECKDGTYYTGITNNLEKRVKCHNAGTGAKYTKHRHPVKVLATRTGFTRSEASKAEYAVKQQPRIEKVRFLANIGIEK